MPTLRVENITVRYKKKIGIKEASLEAREGEIIGFIGPDGAGKSSLMHAVAGVIRFEGEITYRGYTYHSPKEAEKVKPYIGFMPQGIGLVLYPLLTVKEHLDFFTAIRNIKKDKEYWQYREKLLKMAGLYEFQDRQARHLSGGMQQKLSLICTLIHRPKLLILDEPTTGVDPLSRRELWEIIDGMRKKEGIIALISTGYMQEAEKMDKVLLFDDGQIIAKGTASQLKNSIKKYTYAETSCKELCFSFNGKTYSLKPLNTRHVDPDLEGMFFVNVLKKYKNIPEIKIDERESKVKVPEIVIETKGITKRFGSFVANDHIDLIIKKGEIVGLLGPNGAGKTTLIKTILGLYPIDEGSLKILGKEIKSYKDRLQLKSKIGYVSQKFALYKDMTIRENLIYFANMHKISATKALKRINKLAESLRFKEYMDYLPSELPLGINQRFSVAAALIHEPVILFLDEPTSGVDAVARAQLWKLLHQLKEKWGISILITTHYMSEAEFCDRVVLLKKGRKVIDDTPQNLHKRYPHAKSFEDIFIKFYE
ncbi:ATP-binding cassette domain-containing protein [Hydrogenivirga sp. 128-5-R1-1]|uniref:ATP-binding cassette domain-containing protein n=1 Tax=Hydrogenivirga sp. 128-5-R1-1 TaxID=392423 RepID=UPI00015F090C|nr:ATP-binding cassette domain-containing protein [Hydrogenivirga sp. 128-5-R1-1]EDP74077.1 ABC transporter related protein [Hydrogenivirga sp. 128-5-R1-1]